MPRTPGCPSRMGWKARPRSAASCRPDALDLLMREGADEVGVDPQLGLGASGWHGLADELIRCAALGRLTHLGANPPVASELRSRLRSWRSSQVAPSLVTCRSRS